MTAALSRRAPAAMLCAALLCSLSPTEAYAQAWIREPGAGFVELSVRSISGDASYDAHSVAQPLSDPFSATTVSLYAELGLIERWLMLTAAGELYRRNAWDNQGTTQGLGDTRLGLWSGLIEGPLRLSAGAQLGLPTGDTSPTVSGGDASVAPLLPTGDGELDVEMGLVAGTSFGGEAWPLQHYLVMQLGYHARTRGITDGATYRVELGWRYPIGFLSRIWLITKVYGLEPLGTPAPQFNFSGLGDGVQFTAIGLELRADLWQGLGLALSAEGALRVVNIIAAPAFRAGVSYVF